MTDWDEIVTRYGRVAWKIAWRMLGNHADALDCYQRTFMDAIKLARCETIYNWPATLRRLATARALDMLRVRYRQANRSQSLTNEAALISSQPGPQQSIDAADQLERLRTELAELPRRQAEVFCLVALEGMTYREVADRLKISASAVGMLLTRARKRLSERLKLLEPKPENKD